MIDLIVSVLTLLVGAVTWYTSEEKQNKRHQNERDMELANQDSPAISKRLSNLRDRMRKKNHSDSR